jgi:hypothetical protein
MTFGTAIRTSADPVRRAGWTILRALPGNGRGFLFCTIDDAR